MTNPTKPFTDLNRFFERMQSDFEEMTGGWSKEPELLSASLRVDLRNKDDEFVLTAELPGFEKSDINVRVIDRTIRLEAEHTEGTEEEEEGEFVRRERHRASVSRSISLPEAVEENDISATFNNGVVTIRLPKTEPVTQGKQIDIS